MIRSIPRSSYRRMPWKNGRGQTAEVDRFPEGQNEYLWRLSQAPVIEDGPFSQFPGYDRWICVLQGDAIFLNGHPVVPQEPYRFSGGKAVSCRLSNGPILDVGLIFDRNRVQAEMQVVEGEIRLDASAIHYVVDTKSFDTLKIEGVESLNVAKSILVSVAQRRDR